MSQVPASIHVNAHERVRRRAPARVLSLIALAVLLVGGTVPTPTIAEEGRPRAQGSGRQSGAWLVTFRDGVATPDAAAAIAASGATEIGRMDELQTFVVKLPSANPYRALNRLRADERVVTVEEDAVADMTLVPTDPRWTNAWGPRLIRAPEAWNLTTGNSRTIIAVIDTGVANTHPDLRGRVLKGWDFHNNDSKPYDDNGHGTAVANVAGAGGNDGVGIAGICWKCRIMPVKVLNENGSGTHSNIAAGVVWAVDHGADVINMSLATPRATTVMENAIAYARKKGVVVIAAAGNEGSTKRFYPAAYPGVISVAGSTGADRLYNWSNRGTWIKLSAPGCAFTGKPGPAWSWWCGTSFATPAVAGTAALIKSLWPGITRAALERTLLGSAVRVKGVARGRIDAARAVRSAANLKTDSTPKPTPAPTPTPTPRPTPSPTSKPTASPPPQSTSYEWEGSLDSDDHSDRKRFWLAGRTYILLQWWGDAELGLRLLDADGNTVLSAWDDDGWRDEEISLTAGWYELTVSQSSDDETEYKVRIN